MQITIINFKEINDVRGSLVALEELKNIPFNIKRVYYLYNLNNYPRGFHAHKELKQVMIVLQGSATIVLDNGKESSEVVLNQSNQGLLIDTLIWHEMKDLSKDCLIMLLASDYYDESDYIRDYDEFTKRIINV